jgi:hypothetical protein
MSGEGKKIATKVKLRGRYNWEESKSVNSGFCLTARKSRDRE